MRKYLLSLFALMVPTIALATVDLVPQVDYKSVQWGQYSNTGANTASYFTAAAADTVFLGAGVQDTTGPIYVGDINWTGANGALSTTATKPAALMLCAGYETSSANPDSIWYSVETSFDGINFTRNPDYALAYANAVLNEGTNGVSKANRCYALPLSADIDAVTTGLSTTIGTEVGAPWIRVRILYGPSSTGAISGVRARLAYWRATRGDGALRKPSFRPEQVFWKRSVSAALVDSASILIGGSAEQYDTTATISTSNWTRGLYRSNTTGVYTIKYWVVGTTSVTMDSITAIYPQYSSDGTNWTSATISGGNAGLSHGLAAKTGVVYTGQVPLTLTPGTSLSLESNGVLAPYIRFIVMSGVATKKLLNAKFYIAAPRYP